MTTEVRTAPAVPTSGRGQTVVRRIIVFAILFALVVISATGLSGLLDRAIGARSMVGAGETALALALAFALIGAPLAGVLWWWERRRLTRDPSERASLVWALYVIAMSVVSLVTAATSLAVAAAAGIDGEWESSALSTGLVWSGVWVWHRHMRLSTVTAPTRLPDVAVVLGSVFGLAVAVSGAISALAVVISQALVGVSPVLVSSSQWGVAVLQALVWCALGSLVWAWHWYAERARAARGTFAGVALVIVSGVAAAVTLFAVGTALFVLLRALFDTDPLADVLAPLDVALAAALVGAIVWTYHAGVVAERSPQTRRGARLVVAAIALIGAASGFGVIVNALLATLGDPLVENDPRTLLLGGLSALVIGAPVWWIAWRPARPVTAEQAADPARRVYLVAIFGASAVVAIITMLIIGYRLFEFGLDPTGSAGLVERIREPLGLLAATALVFGYHFAIWRRDRALAAPLAPRQTIGRVILVTSGDPDDVGKRVRTETGAPVSVWRPADAGAVLRDEDVPELLATLQAMSGARVLVIAVPGGAPHVVALAD